jgi:hypothetical protein
MITNDSSKWTEEFKAEFPLLEAVPVPKPFDWKVSIFLEAAEHRI